MLDLSWTVLPVVENQGEGVAPLNSATLWIPWTSALILACRPPVVHISTQEGKAVSEDHSTATPVLQSPRISASPMQPAVQAVIPARVRAAITWRRILMAASCRPAWCSGS